jgi:uncharacterized protein (DUF58 family)
VRGARDLALAGATACLSAALFALPALYIPGLAALLAAAAASSWVTLAARRAQVRLAASAKAASEGESVTLTVTVTCGLLPFPRAELIPWPGAAPIPLRTQRTVELKLSTILSRRGLHTLGPARLRVFDPLGVCAAELHSSQQELLVLPRVFPLSASALSELEHERLGKHAGTSPELDSLQPAMAGTSAARIHWPTVARTGILVQRRFTTDADRRVLVVLDASAPRSREALDQAIRAAASLCVHYAQRGGCLLLLPGDRSASTLEPGLHGWPRLHARLALVQGGTASSRWPTSEHRAIIYVTASAKPAPAKRCTCLRVSPSPLPATHTDPTLLVGCQVELVASATTT